MKIIFDHGLPFLLAHGGFQVQIQKTREALESLGVEVESMRWWDETQRGDLIHFFGIAPPGYVRQAQVKNIPVVMTTLFTETCNRSDASLRKQGMLIRALLAIPFGRGIKSQLNWQSFSSGVHNVVGLQAEKKVLATVYGVHPDKISVVPLGTPEVFLQKGGDVGKEDHLICVSTITARKNSALLASLAKETGTPVLFVGNPYSKNDPYWIKFNSLVDCRLVKYHPHVEDQQELAAMYRRARGFVILSDNENWCLTAHEAAASGIPVLLPDQNWSRECFGDQARYFPPGAPSVDTAAKGKALREFYDVCGSLGAPAIRFHLWKDLARQFEGIYRKVLGDSTRGKA